MKFFRFVSRLFFLPVLIPMLLFPSCGKKNPEPPKQAVMTFTPPARFPEFSGRRAFELLMRQTDFGPRVPNSPAHDSCFRFFENFLRPLADTVRIQEFSFPGYDNERLTLRNIIASFNPEAKIRILYCAHWDSRPRADMDKNPENQAKPVLGANDGASGVAVLLHIAEIIAKQRPTAGVDIILFDGEDYGKEGDDQMYCLGSKYFAASVESDYQPLFGILLDMVGDKEAEFLQEEYSLQFASDIVRLVWSSARSLAIPNFKVKGHPPILDDHVPLTRIAGIKTVNIIDAELIGHKSAKPGRKYWHTTQDTPDQCSEKILGRVGKLLLYITFGAQPV